MVVFFDQVFVGQIFVVCIGLEFLMYLFVYVFGKCFCQLIGQGFDYDCVVVVMVGFEFIGIFFSINVGGYGKIVYVIIQFGFFGCDEV